MQLWILWLQLVNQLRSACSHQRTFFWLVIVLIGFTIKFDLSGVTSFVRGLGLTANSYPCLINFFHSTAINLSALQQAWITLVLSMFDKALTRVNGRIILVGDGIKIGKEGKKMPGVKSLHQDSGSNSKAEYIMGHSIQVLCIIVKGMQTFFAVPLAGRIHEGCVFNCKDKKTLLDKLFDLVLELNIEQPFYIVLDKYYGSGKLIKKFMEGNDVIVSLKNTVVAYMQPELPLENAKGRPKKYGKKIKLFDLFEDKTLFTQGTMPNNDKQIIYYMTINLLWRPLGKIVKFVLVENPERGRVVYLSTDLSLPIMDIIFIYFLRFKIEVTFKQAVHQIGSFMYRFWLKAMRNTTIGDGNWQLHFASPEDKEKVKKKLKAYHLFILLGFISQGLLQYLAVYHSRLVWRNFGSWLRTIRPNLAPSEKIVSLAMSHTYAHFLIDEGSSSIFKKFLRSITDFSQVRSIGLEQDQAA